ncbi:hypothetical protein [Curtobacterium flaccumfaciens]|uniref:MmyB family transcriptional regulator n=1 Tax=Curtobacterium flaccumfaciens TaxID=2035 RepID=UPI0039968739
MGDRSLFPGHDAIAQCLVGNLRRTAAGVDEGRTKDLAEELHVVSDQFRALWERRDVQGQHGGTVLLHHPEVGPISLDRERLAVDGAEGIRLAVLHAESASDAAGKLGRLRGTLGSSVARKDLP